MAHETDSYKKNLLHRLKIIRGHLDKVLLMVEEDLYCIDILQQSKAVRSALREAEQKILENHLRHCVSDALRSNTEVETKIDEIIKVFKVSK